MIYTINRQKSLAELERRMAENANGVNVIMAKAGIEKETFSVQDAYELLTLNPTLFRELCVFLYPDLAKYNASADGGKQENAESDDDEAKIVDENGTTVAQGKQSAIDWTSILNSLVATSGGVLTGIYGTRQDPTAAAQLAQQKKDMRMILVVIAIAVAIIVTFAYLTIKYKK